MPQPWTAHGICLTCGLCCYSNKAQHGHTHVWFADADSSCKDSNVLFFYSLKCDFVILFWTFFIFTQIVTPLLLFYFSCKHGLRRIEWACPLIAIVCVPVGTARPGSPYSHFIPSSPTRLELHFVRVNFHLSMISNHWYLKDRFIIFQVCLHTLLKCPSVHWTRFFVSVVIPIIKEIKCNFSVLILCKVAILSLIDPQNWVFQINWYPELQFLVQKWSFCFLDSVSLMSLTGGIVTQMGNLELKSPLLVTVSFQEIL